MAASSSEDDDPHREAKAYNASIYLMLGMPYLMLSIGGWRIYRAIKKAQQQVPSGSGNGPLKATADP